MELMNIAGSLVLGNFIICGLYGVLCAQLYIYYTLFSMDRMVFRILAYSCFVLESIQTLLFGILATIVISIRVDEPSVVNSLDKYRSYTLSIAVITIMTQIIGQSMYAYRLRILYNSLAPSVIVIFLSTCSIIAGLACGVQIYLTGKISSQPAVPFIVYLTTTLLCDTGIVISIVRYLSKQDIIPGSRLKYQVKHLIKVVIVTSGCMVIVDTRIFALYLRYNDSIYFVVPYVTASKFSSNTLMFMFNSRKQIRGEYDDLDDWSGIVSRRLADMESLTSGDHPGAPGQSHGGLVFRNVTSRQETSLNDY